jgi:nucleoside phosphorylase
MKPRILVVAATPRELAVATGWHAVLCGVGPVEAAAATAAAIAEYRPAAVLHVGIAGARRRCALAPAQLVIGGASHYADSNVPETWAPRLVTAMPTVLAAMQHACPGALVRTIGTSARVGGTSDCDVEAMEGFGVLRAAQRAGIPAIEVRAIANDIEEEDRALWHFDAAFTAITRVTPRLVTALAGLLDTGAAHA